MDEHTRNLRNVWEAAEEIIDSIVCPSLLWPHNPIPANLTYRDTKKHVIAIIEKHTQAPAMLKLLERAVEIDKVFLEGDPDRAVAWRKFLRDTKTLLESEGEG